MASVLEIWNAALAAAEARGRLASLTETSPEQEVCEGAYDRVLRSVQSAAWWPSCKTLARLSLYTEAADSWADGGPEPGYAFAYALPADLLHPWYLADYSPFAMSWSTTRSRIIISANAETAILTFARLNTLPQHWTPLQVRATVAALAAEITGSLTGRASLVQRNAMLAQQAIEEAQAQVANMTEPDARASVPWFAARGISGAVGAGSRFFYPFGSYLTGVSNA